MEAAGQDRVRREHEFAKYEFVVIELDLAITFLEMALSTSDHLKSQRNESYAEQANSTALHFLSKARFSEQQTVEVDQRLSRLSSLRQKLETQRSHAL